MAKKTSVETYKKVLESGLLSERRAQVYTHVYHHGPMTARQLTQQLAVIYPQVRADSFQPRLNELRKMSLVETIGETTNEASNMPADLWATTNVDSPKKFCRDVLRQRLSDLGFESLSAYYKSAKWQQFKKEYLAHRKLACYVTGNSDALVLHHVTYEHLGALGEAEDIIPLQNSVHCALHMVIREKKLVLKTAHVAFAAGYLFRQMLGNNKDTE